MSRPRSFSGIAATFIVIGGWLFAFGWIGSWQPLLVWGGAFVGIGIVVGLVAWFLRWQGWE
jgi:hypothetical protein